MEASHFARTDASPLRVLDVTKFYAAVSGGVRTYVDAKMRDFATRPIEHALVIPGEADVERVVGRTRVYEQRGPVVPFSPHYRFLISAQRLRAVVERERPHVVEVGSPFLVPVLVRRALRNSAVRTVGFYHSDIVRTYAEPYVQRAWAAPLRVAARNGARAYVGSVYRRFDVTVAASPAVAAELRSFGVRDVRCIPLGVDLELFRPAGARAELRAKLGVPDDVPIGLFAGRFCSEKRLDVLLDAHRRVPLPERPHLALVGAGGLEPQLREEASRNPRLSILPYLTDREALAATYRGADFYLATGPGETFGLAIAEAMACGLPVVAVNRGAAPDRVDGSGAGELYRHGDAEACARALRRMMDRLGPALRAAARRHAESAFSWRRSFDALVELYTELAAAPARAAAA